MDIALKQRLVGASVLIALAVVVLPMLLGGRPDADGQQTQKIELPPQPPELDFQTRRYPIGEQAPPRKVETDRRPAVTPLPSPGASAQTRAEQQPETAADAGTAAPTDDTSGQDPVAPDSAEASLAPEPGAETEIETASEAPAETAEPVPAPAAPADPAGRYVVQVASFGAAGNASRLSEVLRGYGYTVINDSVSSDTGTLHRVRVGPFSSESEATAAVGRLQTQVKDIRPRVTDLQPEKTAQTTRPSDPPVRWVVQVGSFSSASNAENLVARLRLESMSAYREEVSRSGSTIYRVRIGPFLEREDAIEADRLVAERLSIDGVVMSAD